MRALVLIANDQYVRNLIGTGALGGISRDETFYLASRQAVANAPAVAELPGFAGVLDDDPQRRAQYGHLRRLLMFVYRRRSRTMRAKTRLLPLAPRLRFGLMSLPGLRRLFVALYLRRTGLNSQVEAAIERLDPELIIAPSGGTDDLVTDAIRSGRRRGIPTLVLIHNWDNLSSKGAFAVKPDWLGVWGEQSVEHAVRIHGIPRERVVKLGAPHFEPYVHHVAGSSPPPFDFRYVLFAGCFAPFDERTALELLDRAIEREGLDLKIVYRPHPHRHPRLVPDRIDEAALANVVLDPQVRGAYLDSFEAAAQGERRKPPFPALDYYPALFEGCEFVICPLSTMLVEAAIFERRVIVPAYDDGIHPNSPAVTITYDHFDGVEDVEGFEIARSAEELVAAFLRLARDPAPPSRSLREQIGWWLHHDERSYAERLAELVERIGAGTVRSDAGPLARATSGEPLAGARVGGS